MTVLVIKMSQNSVLQLHLLQLQQINCLR